MEILTQEIKREHDLLDVGERVKVKGDKKSQWPFIKAVLLLLLGTTIAAAFADPLVDTINNFADATSIPSFFVSFIVLPLATSSRDTLSAIRLATQDKRHTASLSFSEVCFSFPTLCISFSKKKKKLFVSMLYLVLTP